MSKNNLKKNGCISTDTQAILYQWVTSGQQINVEPGKPTEVETMEVGCLLACFTWLAQPDFLCKSAPPGQGLHQDQLDIHTQINHQSRKYTVDLSTGNLICTKLI